MNELTDQQIATIKDAGTKLTGTKRRAFQAQVALDYLEGSPRRAERVFGWWRKAVELGLNEQRTGIICLDNTSARGNRKNGSQTALVGTRHSVLGRTTKPAGSQVPVAVPVYADDSQSHG